MSKEFYPPRPDSQPKINANRDTNPQYAGLLKVGYTTIDVRDRVAQQYPIVKPGPLPYSIVLEETAMRNDGTAFTDRDGDEVPKASGTLANRYRKWDV